MREKKHVRVAIIGVGSAGMAAYREVAKHTDAIALIEGFHYGTTCARVGCMPSKLLIAPSQARHDTEKFPPYGLEGAAPAVDAPRLFDRLRRERDRFVGFVEESVMQFPQEHRIWGEARFLDDHTLLIGEDLELSAERIIIATGSTPFVPKPFHKVREALLLSDDIFELTTLPKSMAVIGTGVIGLELSQALARLGVQVTVIGRSQSIGPLSDPDVRQTAAQILSQEMTIFQNSDVTGVSPCGAQVQLDILQKTGEHRSTHQAVVDKILVATGRRPNLGVLDLPKTSLTLDDRGVPCYDRHTMQTTVAHIFIAGDVTGDVQILHEAADEGRIAGENAGQYPNRVRRKRRCPLGVVFCDPEIALVGQSYDALKTEGQEFVTAEVSFENQGRARIMQQNKGVLRLYGDPASGRLLGAEMMIPSGEHVAHLLSWVIQAELTVTDILRMPFYHPVIEEGVRTGLRNLNTAMGFEANPYNTELGG